MMFIVTALAADPLLEGLPDGAEIVRGAETWTVRVSGQSLNVPAPRTAEEEAEVRALVASLLSTLDLAAEVPIPDLPPAPRPRAVAPSPPPAPAPPPAPIPVLADPSPAADRPAPPVGAWIGIDAALRPRIGPGAGLALGGWSGDGVGVGGWVGAHLPRPADFSGSPVLLEAELASEVWGYPVPWLVVGGGAGVAVRRFTLDGDLLATHVVPRAHLRVGVPIASRPLRIELGAGVDVDLGATWIGTAGDQDLLSPVAARLATRLSPARSPR